MAAEGSALKTFKLLSWQPIDVAATRLHNRKFIGVVPLVLWPCLSVTS